MVRAIIRRVSAWQFVRATNPKFPHRPCKNGDPEQYRKHLEEVLKNTRLYTRTLLSLLATGLMAAAPLAQAQAAQPSKNTNIYRVFTVRAAPGKANQMLEYLKTQDPKAAMPGHSLLLRHEAGDSWDFVLIEDLGTKYTIDIAGTGATPMPPSAREAMAQHGDTFVAGPSWAEFTAQLGLGEGAKPGAVYVVSMYFPLPGKGAELRKMLTSQTPGGANPSGDVVLSHVEGAPWQFLEIARYNSFAEYGEAETKSVAETSKGQGQWYQLRELAGTHTDTLATRVE